MEYGFKIKGCMGDVLYSTPIISYLSKSHNKKLLLETDQPGIFINNPYISKIFNIKNNEYIPEEVSIFNCNVYLTREGNQKNIRKMHSTDYWSTNLGFTLHPNEKTLEFYPDPLNISLPTEDYIVLNPSITDACRTWDIQKWESLINLIQSHTSLTIVITGKTMDYKNSLGKLKSGFNIKKKNIIDLTDKLNFSQWWHVIENSRAIVTHNAGALPFSGTTDTHIIHLGGAIHPYNRVPYRKGSQDYKHTFVGGDCELFCQSDLKYSKPKYEKGETFRVIDGFPIGGWCFERKPTFECHPSPIKVFISLLDVLKENYYI